MQKIKQNAFFRRTNVYAWLCAVALGGLPLAGNAAYATLTPPPGWSAGGGAIVAGSGGSYAATTANAWIANAAKSSAMLNVGGRQIAIPVSMKLSPLAGRVAMGVLFNHPAVRVGLGVASVLSAAKVTYDQFDGLWKYSTEQLISGTEYRMSYATPDLWRDSPIDACNDYATEAVSLGYYAGVSAAYLEGMVCVVKFRTTDDVVETIASRLQTRDKPCPAGTVKTPQGCLGGGSLVPLKTEQEFLDRVLNPENQPGWPTVPNELPPLTGLPIELPVINPDTGVNPFPKPLFVPTGQPVPNPQYNPNAPAGPGNQPWKQPGTTVTPQPTPGNPWRVDVAPTDREQAGPAPLPDEQQNPDRNPETDKPKPEDEIGLCDLYPDILACAKPELDTPDGEIPKSERRVDLVEENLFGGGSCPADVYFSPNGIQQLKVWDWNMACGHITSYVKPVILLLATFAAFMILVPGKTE